MRWTLERTTAALRRLERNLATTGQTVERLGHHTYALAARPGIVTPEEVARCMRHDHKPLDLAAASVLHRARTRPGNERTREALDSPAERAAVARLIAVDLLEEKAGVYWPTQLLSVALFRHACVTVIRYEGDRDEGTKEGSGCRATVE